MRKRRLSKGSNSSNATQLVGGRAGVLTQPCLTLKEGPCLIPVSHRLIPVSVRTFLWSYVLNLTYPHPTLITCNIKFKLLSPKFKILQFFKIVSLYLSGHTSDSSYVPVDAFSLTPLSPCCHWSLIFQFVVSKAAFSSCFLFEFLF